MVQNKRLMDIVAAQTALADHWDSFKVKKSTYE
jgi:hypothetical protein